MTITINNKEYEVASSKEATKLLKKIEKEEQKKNEIIAKDYQQAVLNCFANMGFIADRSHLECLCHVYSSIDIDYRFNNETSRYDFRLEVACIHFSGYEVLNLCSVTKPYTKALWRSNGIIAIQQNGDWYAIGACNGQYSMQKINFDISHIIEQF